MPCGTSSSVAACARGPLRAGLLSTIPPRGCSMSMGRLRRRCGARCTSVRWGRIRFRLAVRWRMRGCMCWTGGVSRCRRGGRGCGIELGEVEACLASRAGVREAVVVVRGDILVAYYTGGEVPAESLRAFLSGVLPDYMVPAAFVCLEVLPRTPNGKLDRAALPAPGADSVVRREYQAPRGEAEEVLAGIWSGLLGVGRVGRHDNFFDLGGHSLLAMRLVSRLRAALGVDLPLSKVFAAPVLADLALVAGAAAPARRPPPRTRPHT